MAWVKEVRDYNYKMAMLSNIMQRAVDYDINGEALRDLRWSVGQLAIRALTGSDQQEEAITESLGQQGFVPKPASKASVEALEKFEFHGRHDSSSKCVICMEEMLTGCEVTPMPCSHIFHGDCITKWLSHSSHTCPVCRFELPTED